MKKSNLKAIFLSLLSRRLRRANNTPVTEAIVGADPQVYPPLENMVGADPQVCPEPVSGAPVEAVIEIEDRPAPKSPGPPADWLAKRSSGPPPHWVERVRQAVPGPLQDWKNDKPVASPRTQAPKQIQQKSAPLRLEQPSSPQSSPTDLRQEPLAETRIQPDSLTQPNRRKQEPSLLSFSSSRNAQQRASDTEEKATKAEHKQLSETAPAFGTRELDTNLAAPLNRSQIGVGASLSVSPETIDLPGSGQTPRLAPTLKSGAESPRAKDSADPIYSSFKLSVTDQRRDEAVYPPQSRNNAPPEQEQPHRRTPSLGADGRVMNVSSYSPLNAQAPDEREAFNRAQLDQLAISRVGQFDKLSHNHEPIAAVIPHTQLQTDLNAQASDKVDIRQLKPPEPFGDAVNSALSTHVDESVTHYSDVRRQRATDYTDVIHHKTGDSPERYERHAVDSAYSQAPKKEAEITKRIPPSAAQDQRAISYDVSADRWPALFEDSEDDHFDDAMAAWRELNHRRRLAREQAGSLWNE